MENLNELVELCEHPVAKVATEAHKVANSLLREYALQYRIHKDFSEKKI